MNLEGKRILLGVTGSIAAYKAVELLRLLTTRGAEVQVVMTEAATKFVTPLTFETLTRQPVLLDMWSLAYSHRIGHIEATQRADLCVVAPATAHTIARLALGLADDFLSCIYLASRCPVVVAPAMDCDMYEHPALQENLKRLRELGVHILEPDLGPLASGLVGRGRLAELPDILSAIERILLPTQDLAGQIVLVTAGPTREPLDPVRYLSNRSSGKMGYAVAEAAAARGARVILVSGPTALPVPPGVDVIRVETAQEMYEAVLAKLAMTHVVIKAAAVADCAGADAGHPGRAREAEGSPDFGGFRRRDRRRRRQRPEEAPAKEPRSDGCKRRKSAGSGVRYGYQSGEDPGPAGQHRRGAASSETSGGGPDPGSCGGAAQESVNPKGTTAG